MRKKKWLALMAVMLIVVFMLSMALVACKKNTAEEEESDTSGDVTPPESGDDDPSPWVPLPPSEDDDKPVVPTYAKSFRGAVGYMVETMPSEYLSINFTGSATLNGKRYTMSLKGNLAEDDIEVSAVFKNETTRQLAFGIYIVDSKLFFELEDGTILNVAEIDANYLASIVDKVPDKLSTVIDDLLGSYANLLPTVLDILLGGLSPSSKIVYASTDGVETFDLSLDVQGLLTPIQTLLAPGGILGAILPADLDLSFVSELLSMIPLINGKLNATVDNGRLSEFKVELYDNDPDSADYGQTVLGIDSAITFSSTALQLDLPSGLDTYEAVTLGNLNADFTLSLDTKGQPFDIGALVDGLLDVQLFGEDVLVLDANSDYILEAKVSLDPNLMGGADDNNYINVVLSSGSHEVVRVNYLDGVIYIKALADGVNGFAEGGINVAIPLDLKSYVSQLVTLVTDAIDGLLGTQFRPEAGTILTASVSESGEVILTPSIQSVITGVLELIGFEDCITMTGDKITVAIDDTLFEAISNIANIGPIDLPITGELIIGLFAGGIEYVEINAMDVLTLRVDDFLIGKSRISREYVEGSIGDTRDYGSDAESIVKNFALSLISDLDVEFDLDLSTVDTTVNLTPVINGFMSIAGTTYLKMPIVLDLSNYDGTFKLRLATNYDDDTDTGRLLLELTAPSGDTLISAYGENSNTYVDLSGIGFMKFCLTGVDLMQYIRGMLGAEITETFIEEVAPTIALAPYTSGVEIDSDSVGLAVSSYFVTFVMRMLAMDLGIDVSLNAHLNFDGSLGAQLGLGNAAKLGFDMKLGRESQSTDRISSVIATLPKSEYGEYNAIDAEMLVDSILVSERLNLTLDLYNNNVDYSSHDNKTRIVIRNSTASAPGTVEVLDNGLQAPYKSIVLIIYDGWNYTTSEALLFAYIDFDNKKIQFKGTEKMLSINLLVYTVTGELLDIGIDNVDLKKTLVDALSGLFGEEVTEGDGFGGVIDVPDGALPEQKPVIGHRCGHKCPECGKCLDVSCEDPACADKCDGQHEPTEPTPPIEEIIPGVKITLTGSMDIDVDVDINGTYISKVLKDLLTGVFTDMDMESMTGSAEPITIDYDNENANVFFNSLYTNLILPLISEQVSNALGGGGSLVSSIANSSGIKNQVHALVQRFLPLPNIEDLAVNVSITDGKLANVSAIGSNSGSDYGFGLYLFNRKADSVISWEHQDTDIYFNTTLGQNLIDMFETRARKHTVSNWEEDSWDTIAWTLKDSAVDLATFNANIGDYEDGEYIFVGSAWDETLEVKVTLHSAEIDHVQDIHVQAMRYVPSYVTAVFTDGVEKIFTDVEISYDSRVTADDNASVELGDDTYVFTLSFEEEELSVDTLTLNAYDYLNVIEGLETNGIVRAKVNNLFYRNLPATYDFSEIKAMSRQDLQRPDTYEVTVHIGEGTDYECDRTMAVEFTPFEIYSIKRNGLNYIETDFIEYAKGESFPEEITVVGYNGRETLEYTAKVSEWDISGVTIDLKGGQYFASAVLNGGEFNEWRLYGIEVDVISTEIVDLADSSKSVVFDWKYYFYGNVPLERVVPTLLNFTTSDGTIKTGVPVTIDVTGIFADSDTVIRAMREGMTFECPVSVDVENDGKSLFETTVEVVVPSVTMSLIEDEIDVDYQEYMRYGKSAFFREHIEIMLGDDTVSARVTWFTDEVVFNRDGSYTAIVYIDQDGEYEQSCEVTVNITGAPAQEV